MGNCSSSTTTTVVTSSTHVEDIETTDQQQQQHTHSSSSSTSASARTVRACANVANMEQIVNQSLFRSELRLEKKQIDTNVLKEISCRYSKKVLAQVSEREGEREKEERK